MTITLWGHFLLLDLEKKVRNKLKNETFDQNRSLRQTYTTPFIVV